MLADVTKPPAPLPSADLHILSDGVSLLPPLSRVGIGPGLILLLPDDDKNLRAIIEGVPSPLTKWCEEGYAVVAIQSRALRDGDTALNSLRTAVEALKACLKCKPKDKIGLVGMSFQTLVK